MQVVTLSDSSGYVVDEEGIDAARLAYVMDLKNNRRGRIAEYAERYPSATFVAGKKPWDVATDVAIPCATQNELSESDARRLLDNGCRCVTEGANMPCDPEAVRVFLEAKILFAPGKAANSGGPPCLNFPCR